MPQPEFWRDNALPFLEARSIKDARKVCYAKHVHDTFSIGVISGGRSTYLNGKTRERVGPGTVVVINLVNCRIEYSREQLRRGRSIAAVALDAGFSDQAHLQRAFRKLVAATPGQYRG